MSRTVSSIRKAVAFLVCYLLFASAAAVADEGGAVAGETEAARRTIQAVRIDEPPQIDGKLDDACWQTATHVEGLWRTVVDAAELEPTEAWICYGEEAIYAAFRCHDSRPSEIRYDQKKRQGNMGRDDNVNLGIDADNNGTDVYTFRVNAAGVQQDEVPGGTSEKIEWKGDWRAAAQRDESGWTAEMEIPFAMLRYPDGQDTFGIYVGRYLAREEDWAVWPQQMARKLNYSECASLQGLTTPDVGFRCVLMPYALSVASENDEDRELLTGGLDVKGTFPNGVVALGTYNPDFRNIEDVVETIDFTYVERYLPEYRPFFQEGSWFLPSSRIFYSRRIEDVDWGLKTFGTVGQHRFGLLDTYARGGENHAVLDYEYLLTPQKELLLSAVDRNVPGEPDNLAFRLGTSMDWPFDGGGHYFRANHYGSITDGEGGDGSSANVYLSTHRQQGWSYSASYEAVQPEFRADDGYVPEPGVRNVFLSASHERVLDEGRLQGKRLGLEAWTGESQVGDRRGYWGNYDWNFRNGWALFTGGGREERDGFEDRTFLLGAKWNRNDVYHFGEVRLNWGERYGETYRYQSLAQTFHPTEKWSAALGLERVYQASLDEEGAVQPSEWFRQGVLTTTYDITDEKTVSARLVRSRSDTNAYAAYRQRTRKGMDILVLAGDPNASQWVSRVAVKVIWCL